MKAFKKKGQSQENCAFQGNKHITYDCKSLKAIYRELISKVWRFHQQGLKLKCRCAYQHFPCFIPLSTEIQVCLYFIPLSTKIDVCLSLFSMFHTQIVPFSRVYY